MYMRNRDKGRHGPRPTPKHKYDPELGWLSPAEVVKLQQELYGQLKAEGFRDLERFLPNGAVDRRLLSGGNRTVNLHSYVQVGDADDLPANLNAFYDARKAREMEAASEQALQKLLNNAPWDTCLVYAAYAGGLSQRDTADAMGVTRIRVRKLLAPLQDFLAETVK